MKETEFFRNISVGQFFEADSWARRLTPGVKLAFVALSMTTIIVSRSLVVLTALSLSALIVATSAQVPPKFIAGGLKPAMPFILIIALLQIIFMTRYDEAPLVWQLWRIRITTEDLAAAASIILRFTGLMFYISLFTAITPTPEIIHGTELVLRPFAAIGVPSHEISMVIAVTFRFIPILAGEAEKIIKAQASRGADFGTPGRGLIRRIRSFFPLYVPLFLAALERAERMIMSMEARCYAGGRERSHLVVYPMRKRDYLFLSVTVVLFSVAAWAGIRNIDTEIIQILFPGGIT